MENRTGAEPRGLAGLLVDQLLFLKSQTLILLVTVFNKLAFIVCYRCWFSISEIGAATTFSST